MGTGASWLCPTELDRARVAEASERLRRARGVGSVAIGVALLASVPFLGWWTLLLFGVAGLNLVTMERRLARSERPERVAMASVLSSLFLLALTVALTGGPASPLLPWLVIPGASAAARFRGTVTVAVAALTALATLAATAPVDPAGLLDDPVPLIATLVLLVNVTGITGALMRAELGYRDRAVLDPLTGLLNRAALVPRVAELEQQARLTGASVSLVACDIDRFKRVNDTYGHERGDAVLRDLAYELRKCLRTFDPVYRIGGEEFLVVLPGVDLAEAVEVAERLRRTVAAARPGGLELTLSAGVSSAAGEHMRYEALFRAADGALLRAKRAGRDRVEVAGDAPSPPGGSERRRPSGASAEAVGSAG